MNDRMLWSHNPDKPARCATPRLPRVLDEVNRQVRMFKDGCTPADDQRAIEFLVFDAFREGGRHG